MTRQQIEEKIIELIHHEPFIPFQIEKNNGEILIVPHPRLAINNSGAGFIGPEGGLIDIDFAEIRAIATVVPEKSK